MIASLVIFMAVLIFAMGVLITGRLSRTVLFLSLCGLSLSILFLSMGARMAALAEFIFGFVIIPVLFHRVMLRLPKEVQDEKRDWVFPFQKSKGNAQLPISLKVFPLVFIFFAILAWLFVPMFFREVGNFMVKLPQPEPFLNILWETKKTDFFAVLMAIVAAVMFIVSIPVLKNQPEQQKKTEEYPNDRDAEQQKTSDTEIRSDSLDIETKINSVENEETGFRPGRRHRRRKPRNGGESSL